MNEPRPSLLGFTNAGYRAQLLSRPMLWWYVAILRAAVPVIWLSGRFGWIGPTYFIVTVLFLVGVVPTLTIRARKASQT